MKAIVIGGGMGGMTAALALEQAGFDTEVFEAVKTIRPVGAAISVWPNGVKCLNALGLKDKVRALGGNMAYMAYKEAFSGDTLTRFSLSPLVQQVGEFPYPIARAELQSMLLDAYGRHRVNFGKRIVQVEQYASGVIATFEDNSQAQGDFLVAADGTHSVIRDYVLGEKLPRRYAGYVNWNGLVSVDESLSLIHI